MAASPDLRPRIDYLATGGTIASVQDTSQQGLRGAAPTLTADEIAAATPEIDDVANVRRHQFLQQPSTSLTVADLLRMRDDMATWVADGTTGFVVSQGTDTIEEAAFVLDLLWNDDAPVVITGAMRNPSAPGDDGPANLLAAVQVAAAENTRGLGCLIVLNDEIHAARFVRKMHTSALSAFRSPIAGPIGWVSEGRPMIVTRPAGRTCLRVPPRARIPRVALVRVGLDDDGRMLTALPGLRFEGVVIEGFGGGHVTPPMVPLIGQLATTMPVVLTSRTGSGEVLTKTYRFPGSEIEILHLGVIRAGALDGVKARLLLVLALAAGSPRERIAQLFHQVGMASGPVIP